MSVNLETFLRFVESQDDFASIVQSMPPSAPALMVPRPSIIEHAVAHARRLAAEPPEIRFEEMETRRYLEDITPDLDLENYERARAVVLYCTTKFFGDGFGEELFASPDLREVRHVSKIPKEGPILYLPNHNSHADSFLLSLKLNQLRLDPPYFAAGDNLLTQPDAARILSGVRSFKVYRKDKNEGHLRALSALCRTFADLGLPQLTYPEASGGGARSRDGTLRIPFKLRTIEGIAGSERDVTVVPVALTYTRVPEDYSLAHGKGILGLNLLRNLKGPSQKPSLFSLFSQSPLRAWFQSKALLYGKLYITFAEPFSLHDFVDSISATEDPVEALERYAMSQVGRHMKVLPHYIVAAGLDKPESAPHRSSRLVDAVQEEIDKLKVFHQENFRDEPDFSDDFNEGPEAVIEKGLAELQHRGIISRHRSSIRMSWFRSSSSWTAQEAHVKIQDPALLSYYHNRSHHNLYAPELLDKVCVIGAGQWGYTLAVHLGRKLQTDRTMPRLSVILTDADEKLRTALESQRRHPFHFTDFGEVALLPGKVSVKSPKRAIRGASVIVLVVPSQYFRGAMKQVCDYVNRDFDLVVATKGIEVGTNQLMIEVAEQVLDAANLKYAHTVSVLSGANLASEILRGLPAATQITSADYAVADRLRKLFESDRFKVYTNTDVMGTQLAGALKNVYAVAVGLVDGLDMGNNLKASIISRVTPEARRLAAKMGGSTATFDAANQAWMADLITTCLAGRNHAYGLEIGKAWAEWGEEIQARSEVIEQVRRSFEERRLTVEGDHASMAIHDLSEKNDVEMPIAEEVYRVLYRGKNPYHSLRSLIQR